MAQLRANVGVFRGNVGKKVIARVVDARHQAEAFPGHDQQGMGLIWDGHWKGGAVEATAEARVEAVGDETAAAFGATMLETVDAVHAIRQAHGARGCVCFPALKLYDVLEVVVGEYAAIF